MLWAGWDAVAHWWDGVELWLTQLGLAFQIALLMLVLLPLCWRGAVAFDRVTGLIFERLDHRYAVETQDAQEPQ